MIDPGSRESPLENRIAEHFRYKMADLFSLSDAIVPSFINVRSSDAEVYLERFPAVLDLNHASEGREATLWYNLQAVEDVAREFGEDARAFASIENLYIAGSVSLGLLLNSIDPTDSTKIELLSNQFTNMAELQEAIDKSEKFDTDGALNLKLALSKSSEERLKRIGILRFVVGIYGFLSDETSGVTSLRSSAYVNIQNALRNRLMLQSLMNAAGVITEAETEYRVDRQFTDAASEMSLALAFPMDLEELRAIIELATTRKTESSMMYTEEVVEECPEHGFHEVD